MAQLRVGDAFPAMAVTTVDGRQLNLPGDLEGRFPILLFYRAWW
jgi:peroxiredoxin